MTLLSDTAPARPAQPWDRLLLRCLAASIDRDLASGAGSRRRLASTRAEQLVSTETRRRLASNWQALIVRAAATPVAGDPAAPLCRERVLEARDEIGALVAQLCEDRSVDVRGVAMASALLGDGSGPLYNPRCDADLRHSVCEVIVHLAPSADSLQRR